MASAPRHESVHSEGESRITHLERTHSVESAMLIRSQSGTLARETGLRGVYTPDSALVVPPGVQVDLRFTTFLAFIHSFMRSAEQEPDTTVRESRNSALRRFTCGTRYYREWQATKIRWAIRKQKQSVAQSQTGEWRPESSTTTVESEVEQTVEFHTDIDQVRVSLPSQVDSTRLQVGTKGISLGDWLARPVKLATHSLSNGASMDVTFNPWFEFLNNNQVKQKLTGYALLRGDLHVKFMINGGPFYFGNIIVGYKPQGHGYDFVIEPNDIFPRAVLLSQRMHLFLNPTTSQGGELILPFFHHKNYIDLTSSFDALNMGAISMLSLAPLQRAMQSASTRQINIVVVAWMDNVEIASPTVNGIFSQSGSLDEYGKGVISKPASAIAAAAGRLKSIPVIGPYATATQMIATGVGNIAQLFGFSHPINLEPIRRYKPKDVGILANSCIEEATEKLTFDPKQELTIDHNVTGAVLPDEMTIWAIASKSSLIGQFDWSMVNAEGVRLQTIHVTPIQTRTSFSTAGAEHYMTPMSHAAFPFRYWRGGIKYRFQIMASDLHRGRLIIVYEPRGFVTNVLPDLNSVYCRIIDLEETKDFTLPVYWMQDKSWLRVEKSAQADFMNNGTLSAGYNDLFHNGSLRVFVLNELAGPDEDLTNYVRVNVYASAADDFDVAEPDDYIFKHFGYGGTVPSYTSLDVTNAWSQSGVLNNAKSARESQPGHMGTCELDPVGMPTPSDNLALVYFGEKFLSFRDLMKRYTLCAVFARSVDSDLGTKPTKYTITLPNFPLYRGRTDPSGMYRVVDGGQTVYFNTNNGTLLNWLTPAFAARRGGIRYKYVLGSAKNVDHSLIAVSRTSVLDPIGTSETLLSSDTATHHANYTLASRSLWQGGAITTEANYAVEVELPFHTNAKFADASDTTAGPNGDQRHTVEIYDGNRAAAGNMTVYQYVSTGEDFNLTWYVNAPTFFYFNPQMVV